MSMVDLNWNPTPKEMRRFGLSGLVILGLVGGVFYWRGVPVAMTIAWVAAGVTFLSSLIGGKIGRPIYLFWMAVSFVMGNVVSRVVVALFYFLMITPYGLVMRLLGRDKLQLKKPAGESYWHPVTPVTDKKRYMRQF